MLVEYSSGRLVEAGGLSGAERVTRGEATEQAANREFVKVFLFVLEGPWAKKWARLYFGLGLL